MKCLKNKFLRIALAWIWISVSEFTRNEFFVKSYWIEHYQKLGLTFPSEPINGAIWGIWALVYAIVIFILSQKFTLRETFLLAWVIGFVMMWLVIGNMGVLPYGILIFAIPLSLLEAFVASLFLYNLKKD